MDVSSKMNKLRCRNLIDRAIDTFRLDLSGLVVLTEAATGYYVLTAMIAAISGAQRVYAITRDSRYGKIDEVYAETMALASQWGVANRIEVLFSRQDERIGQVDIVTNLGFVRPLDKPFLQHLKPTAVIPLMWETWEYRAEDVDLYECRRLGIPVLGTNEHHPDLQIFGYIGHIALKLLFALDIEVFHAQVVVMGSGAFAEQTVATLRANDACVMRIEVSENGRIDGDLARQFLRQADALVIVEHRCRWMLIGAAQSQLSAQELHACNPGLAIAHICGGVDRASLVEIGLRCCPAEFAVPGYMSVATDYVGPKPLIDLHTAGLKVGEQLARLRGRGLEAFQAEMEVLKRVPLAQGFVGYHI